MRVRAPKKPPETIPQVLHEFLLRFLEEKASGFVLVISSEILEYFQEFSRNFCTNSSTNYHSDYMLVGIYTNFYLVTLKDHSNKGAFLNKIHKCLFPSFQRNSFRDFPTRLHYYFWRQSSRHFLRGFLRNYSQKNSSNFSRD